MPHRSYCNNYVAHFRAINISSVCQSSTIFFKISRVFELQHSILLVDKIEIKILRITVHLKLSKKRSIDKISSSQPQRNFKEDAFIFHQKNEPTVEKNSSHFSSHYCSRQKIRGSGIRKAFAMYFRIKVANELYLNQIEEQSRSEERRVGKECRE